MNVRVNVLYFIETLSEQSVKADYPTYVKMVQRDRWTIVDAVVPNNPEGAVNAETARKVRHGRWPLACWHPESPADRILTVSAGATKPTPEGNFG